MTREEQRELFLKQYEGLNAAQREAVDSIEGPVMVIAGPGTGKTQILAIRIGRILMETDTRPENILCMTFTDAGAIAMRRRLLKMIGADAHRVHIHTYHSFCNQVIQDNLSYFEKNALDPVSELESITMVHELIDGFKQGNPLKRYRGDVYFETTNLLKLFSTMKREGWSAQQIKDAARDYLASLKHRPEFIYQKKYKEFNAGDLKPEKYREQVEAMDRLCAAVDEFDRYQQKMMERKRYDFDDMINWVIRAFDENKNMLANYQEQFQYVLVDEYQDTSGIQNKLVKHLISYWEEPNIFVVGDDDQSIFRFQGANVENMATFLQAYPGMKVIMLTENYRSVQPILDAARTVIDSNQERLIHQVEGLSKILTTAKEELKAIQTLPSIHAWNTPREEMIGITDAIAQLVGNGTDPHRIAVIYRENKYGEEISEFLHAKGISYYSKRSLNLLQINLIRKLIRLFEYLDAEMDVPFSGDQMLFEILHYDWFGIRPLEIAQLSLENNERGYKKAVTGFRRIIEEKRKGAGATLFDSAISPQLSKAGEVVEGLIGAVHNITLQQLLDRIIRDTGVLSSIMRSNDPHWELQVLTTFFDFLKDETRRNPSLSLASFMKIIRMMKKEEIALPIVQVGGNEKGVNLLTVHGSKGLEFEHVFVAGTNSVFWENKKVNSGGYKIPDTLFQVHQEGDRLEELRRLFYVALARAEQHLCVSYAKSREDGKGLEPSQFIEEVRSGRNLPVEEPQLSEETVHAFRLVRLTATEAPVVNPYDSDVINTALEKFVMNVTALNNYLNCPLEFFYHNLIRIPSPKNETLEFGSAVHYALESFFSKMKNSPTNTFPSKDTLINDFISYLYRHRESFTKEEFERRMEYGKQVLDQYHDARIHTFSKIVSVERNVKNVVVDGVPLKGKIDKMEFDGHLVNVVDYKTGNPDRAKEKLKGPNDKEPNGGDYWRQAVFYKLLVDKMDQGKYSAVSTEFDFIEPNAKKEIASARITITEEDTSIVRKQVREVWEKIQAKEFYTGCGDKDCHWCNFVKANPTQFAST
ncbi:MAG: ATP-dependent helicase [Bacteroidota bacterium]